MIQLQIHYNVQTPILKSKEIQAIDPLEDTSNHRLQIFLLNSIHSFNLSFLKTLVHMACLQTTTHMEGFILVFHMKPTLAFLLLECLEEELQLKVFGLHHQLSPWLIAMVMLGQVRHHRYLLYNIII